MFARLTPEQRIAARYVPPGFVEMQRDGTTVAYADPVKPVAIVYSGKSARCEWYTSFGSRDAMTKAIERFFSAIITKRAELTRRRDLKKSFHTSLKPGDIVYTSWGYDQTNIDFYQVVEVVGRATVVIRQLDQTRTETGFMCGHTEPIPGSFRSDSVPMRKIVQVYGEIKRENEYISFAHSSARIWDGKPKNCSWYA